MIYLLLFWEFFKIGLFAVGGGLVTVPFLYNLAEVYPWFSTQELANMIAVAESTPGPVGVNMATFAGFKAAGITGGLAATAGLIFPSLVIIILLAGIMNKFRDNDAFNTVLATVRPTVLALILSAGYLLAESSITDIVRGVVLVIVFAVMYFWKKHPIFYILCGAVGGIICGLF